MNRAVGRRNHKYRFAAERKGRSQFLFWLLILALAATAGWLLLSPGRDNKPKSAPPLAQTIAQLTLPPTNRPQPAPVPEVQRVPPPSRTVAQPTNPAPPTQIVAQTNWPRAVHNPFEAQLVLVRQGISPGSIDGVVGLQTRSALSAFQQREQLPVTGKLDDATKGRLLLTVPPLTNYIVTSNDVARLQPLATNWLGKSQQTALEFETILELVAEKSFSHPDFIKRLNPLADWTNVAVGAVLQVPNATHPEIHAKAAYVEIQLAAKTLEAFDANSNLLVHFPCSIAKLVEKRPAGELHVAVIARNPNYTFDPDVFPESPEARQLNQKLILPPGPNNPVGVAWIGLDRPGYGIHGTPKPEDVGRTESHGCFRLANWNAEYLSRLVVVGTPVNVLE